MSRIVFFKPLEGVEELPLNLDQCLGRVLIYADEPWPENRLVFYRVPGDRWVRHEVYHYPPDDPVDAWDEVPRAEVEHQLSLVGKTLPRKAEASRWEVDSRIIDTLKLVNCRLTTTQLQQEMKRRGLVVSPSTIKKRLAAMVKERRLISDLKANPPGYGLPEWNGSPGT
jgi:hypothetical protein